jgi:formyltetrahydrofolate deformylase
LNESKEAATLGAGSNRLLLVDCPDRSGLIHQITGLLAARGANIINNAEFVDRESGRFFMRTEFSGAESFAGLVEELRMGLPSPANVRLGTAHSRRIVVLATREHHCLGELLLRHAHDELGAEILAVVSNHTVLEALTRRFDLPFHYVPHAGVDREVHEAAIHQVLDKYNPDYLVLAKYMRLLSPAFVSRYPHRMINIHHSFLPAFVGANPYRQAFERGVKIIGATAHFVTETLDAGPIIAQAVVPVDHSYRAEEMAQAGRDVEKIVLAQALKLVLEERVFLNGSRTIVFD